LLSPLPAVAQVSNCDPARQRQLFLNINDKDGVFISSAKAEDLQLTIDKQPARVLKLEPKTDQPLSVVMLLDTSMSQSGSFLETKVTAQKFIQAILRSKLDRAAVVSFAGEPTLEADLTNDTSVLLKAVGSLAIEHAPAYVVDGTAGRGSPPIQRRRQGTTAMWDAIWAATDDILQYVDNSRRVILLLSDGSDSSSSSRWRETIEHVALNDVEVFAIGFSDLKYFDIVAQKNLEDLTETNGRSRIFPEEGAGRARDFDED
jgi:VWFA-related protein